jgi:hypothetical protein
MIASFTQFSFSVDTLAGGKRQVQRIATILSSAARNRVDL